MKKIFYTTNVRIPTEKAHGIQIMKMCEAFANLGIETELVIPNRMSSIKQNPFDYYGIKKIFKITRLRCLSWTSLGKIGFWTESITFALSASVYLMFKNGIVYTRSENVGLLIKILGKRVFWEAHMGHFNSITKVIINLKIKIIVITQGLKNFYANRGMPEDYILVAPDAVDVDQFDIVIEKNEARIKLGLPLDKKIVLYTGHLYSWKGTDTLAKSGEFLPPEIALIFIGGTPWDLNFFKEKYGNLKNIMVLGQKSYIEIPLYLKAADLLVIPNSAKEDISRLYTSPMKLFEYMASHTPILSSSIPSIREILDEKSGYFFIPDNEKDLAKNIVKMFENYTEAKNRAEIAFNKVQNFTWEKRAQNVINFIEQK